MHRAVLGALILGSCAATQTHPIEDLLTSRHAAQVETPFSTGSAFPITDSAWLTAWHVVEGWEAENVTVDGFIVLEITRCGELDAAVLSTAPHGRAIFPLADRAHRAGERLYKSGYGQGLHWWTEGIGTEDPHRVAIDIYPGDSGCPIFDAQGRVVGIIVGVGASHRGTIEHHCWIVPMSEIMPVLPPGLFDPEPPRIEPALPATPRDEAWERFLRRKKELGL